MAVMQLTDRLGNPEPTYVGVGRWPVPAVRIRPAQDGDFVAQHQQGTVTRSGQQRQRIVGRWPDGTQVLFSRPTKDIDGSMPGDGGAYRGGLRRWLARCDIRDEAGSPIRLTPHQLGEARHTYAPTPRGPGSGIVRASEIRPYEWLISCHHHRMALANPPPPHDGLGGMAEMRRPTDR